ncbi:MAG: glycine oxidase ThiO [Terriglobia bacterium]
MSSNLNPVAHPDVLVIGGGIIGCSIAMRLAQGGLKVTVLEKGKPGGEASSAAAGMIAPQGEITSLDPFFELCAQSRDLYPSFVSEIEQLSGRELYYRRNGTMLVALNDREVKELEATYQGQTEAGLAVERLTGVQIGSRVGGLLAEIREALYVAGDHWVDNEELSAALAVACERLGVQFRAGTEVKRLNLNGKSLESVETSLSGAAGTNFSAGCYVLAAGAWSGELASAAGIKLPVLPCRGQMMEFESDIELPMVLRAGHYYLVPRANHRVLAGATAEYVGHHKAVTAEGLQSILEGVARMAPFVKQMRFRRAWSGLRPDTADHMPVLGPGHFENLIFATGHFRNGILLAPVTAKLISELILTGVPSCSLDAYSPNRFETGAPSSP